MSRGYTRAVNIERARYLVSAAGREALASLDPELGAVEAVALSRAMRKRFPPGAASALAEQLTLRHRARSRFEETRELLLTGEGLEMMTRAPVALRRAERLRMVGLPVVDLTCGLGGDLMALREDGVEAVGLERDGATALLAAQNAGAGVVVLGDAARPPFELAGRAVVLDPSRRTGRGRTFDPAAFTPPWEVCLGLLDEAAAGALKAPPGIDHRAIPAEAEVEFVQLGRVLREAAVYTGRGAVAGLKRAVLLPGGETVDSTEPETGAGGRGGFGAWIADPESCVTRAGLVRQLAHRCGAWLIDPQLGYLAADEPVATPLAAWFEVLEVMAFSVGRLKELLRRRGWRPGEVRRRAFPVEPDELLRLLGPMNGEPVVLFCTTVGGARKVVIGRRWNQT